MPEPISFFETFTEHDVSRWVNALALVTVIVGPLFGLTIGALRRPRARYLLLGCMMGLVGPLAALSWHIVDARTSHWDYIYRDKNPDIPPRVLWPVLGAGKLDSVRNLAGLAVGFVLAGVAIGVASGFYLMWLNRRFPRETEGGPEPVAAAAGEDSGQSEGEAAEDSGGGPEEAEGPSAKQDEG